MPRNDTNSIIASPLSPSQTWQAQKMTNLNPLQEKSTHKALNDKLVSALTQCKSLNFNEDSLSYSISDDVRNLTNHPMQLPAKNIFPHHQPLKPPFNFAF